VNPPQRPYLRIVRGEPTGAEVAALVTVLAARAATASRPGPPRSAWADPARRLRGPVRPGPDAWRRSALP
jgi:Acyl-CoA carboxylase epsilon subunit